MRKTASVVLASMLGSVALAIPAHAEENVAQFCVDFTDNGTFQAHLAEDRPSWEAMLGHRVAPFVNSASSCGGLGPGDGDIFNGPVPEFPSECAPEVVVQTVEKIVRVEVPVEVVRYVETSSVQTVTDTELVDRLRAKINRLQKRLAAKR